MVHLEKSIMRVIRTVIALQLKFFTKRCDKTRNCSKPFAEAYDPEDLSSHDVQGMVPYRKAFEAFVVMDRLMLGVAVASRLVADWDLIIGSDTANIVRKGQQDPERVLHRDIRPSNVMIRGFYSDPQNWDVVVLDFDLSWHRGALEKSVIYGSARLGYLAPEQIEDIPGVSTRHAAVDSFGLGMVLFFMLSGRDPVPEEHRHTDWADKLTRAAASKPCQQWVSTPTRFARLIRPQP